MGKKLRSAVIIIIAVSIPVPFTMALSNHKSESTRSNQTTINTSDVKAATTQINIPFNKQLYPTNDYKSLWAIISNDNQVPSDYRPEDLELLAKIDGEEIYVRSFVKERALKMMASAAKYGLTIKAVSGLRSYTQQQTVFLTKPAGIAAKPGHSEHQLGLSLDVTTGTNENIWLANHAHKYGFIIRYPENKQSITGFAYEPWHLRYVGVELATEIKNSNKTMEEYFGQR